MLDLAKKNNEENLENISFYLSGAENLSIFQESTFDIVATRFAFHHFNDPLKVFKEVGRILNPNGIFLIIDLQGFEDEKKSKLNQIIELLHDETHILSYSLSQFINFAYHSNFTIDLHLSHLRESFTGINIEDWCNLTQHSINQKEA